MSGTKDIVFHVRVPTDFSSKLADLRKLEDDLPSTAEMLRRLVDRAHAIRMRKKAA